MNAPAVEVLGERRRGRSQRALDQFVGVLTDERRALLVDPFGSLFARIVLLKESGDFEHKRPIGRGHHQRTQRRVLGAKDRGERKRLALSLSPRSWQEQLFLDSDVTEQARAKLLEGVGVEASFVGNGGSQERIQSSMIFGEELRQSRRH
jgi:hypothetical protein